jgi:hypothetical protein
MTTTPRLIERHNNYADLSIRTRAGVIAYRVGAANTLDTAFAGTTAMFTAKAGTSFRSKGIRQAKKGRLLESNRGLTRMVFDPDEYFAVGGDLPHDNKMSYVRVEEQNPAGTFLSPGPILVMPPCGFWATPRPSLTLRGTAPNVATTADLTPPPGAMVFVLPRFSDHVTIVNEDAAALFVSFDSSMPEITVKAGATTALFDGAYNVVYVRGDGATVEFSMFFAIVNGEMG